jgi:hypothetical protein
MHTYVRTRMRTYIQIHVLRTPTNIYIRWSVKWWTESNRDVRLSVRSGIFLFAAVRIQSCPCFLSKSINNIFSVSFVIYTLQLNYCLWVAEDSNASVYFSIRSGSQMSRGRIEEQRWWLKGMAQQNHQQICLVGLTRVLWVELHILNRRSSCSLKFDWHIDRWVKNSWINGTD